MIFYDVPKIQHKGLREIHCGEYTLVRYTKPLQDPCLEKYRSVVYKGDKLVAFSPPRSTPIEEFELECSSSKTAVVRDYIDGIMIYVWFDNDVWHTSTRSCVEGEKIFRRGVEPVSRLDDVECEVHPLTPYELFKQYTSKFETFFELLEKSTTYVFTLTDPSSFNVVKPSTLECYLTNVYKILDGNEVVNVPLESVLPSLPGVNVPTVHYFRTYLDIVETLSTSSYTVKGFMLYDPVNDKRAKMLNPAYLKVHKLLSSKPNFNELVLDAILDKSTIEIESLHPDFSKNIAALEKNILRCSNLLYSYYLECFVKKVKPHKDFPPLYRGHMYELQKMYLQSFRTLGFRMNKTVVLDYIKGLPTLVLMPLLRVY